jgi:hypothetical protein
LGESGVYELGVTLLFLLVMAVCFWIGMLAQRLLREHHRSQSHSIRLVITMLTTFAALVLGLVIPSSQTRFRRLETVLRAFSVDITELGQRLRQYGPEVDPPRAKLIAYTKAAIADTWPDETPPSGDYPRNLRRLTRNGIDSAQPGRC